MHVSSNSCTSKILSRDLISSTDQSRADLRQGMRAPPTTGFFPSPLSAETSLKNTGLGLNIMISSDRESYLPKAHRPLETHGLRGILAQ